MNHGSRLTSQPARNPIACLKSSDARSPITERPAPPLPHPGLKTHRAGHHPPPPPPDDRGPTRDRDRDEDRGHAAQVTGKDARESDPRRRQCEPTWVVVVVVAVVVVVVVPPLGPISV